MKKFFTTSMGLAIGISMVAPVLLAGPTSVNGSLGGFSANAQGGQNANDWGIPDGRGRNTAAQNSKGSDAGGDSANGQNAPTQASAKGPDAGGYGGHGQNPQTGGGQNGPGEQQGKGPEGGGQNGPGEQQGKGPEGGGQNGPGEQQGKGPEGGGQNGPGEQQGKGPEGGGQNGDGSADDQGPTKNHSNNDGSGSAEDDGPTKNHSNSNGEDGGRGENASSSGGGNGSGEGEYPPLDPSSDGQYDPANNEGDQQIPSGCAEAGSACAQCVQHNENVVQFNRRYLHVAWSVTHQTIEYTKQMIAFGDSVSGIHQTQALAWQLAGKPQITEAVASLRKTYDNKYRIYINNMEQALHAMNECEQDNFAVRDLYQRFSALYLEFVKARYQSPD